MLEALIGGVPESQNRRMVYYPLLLSRAPLHPPTPLPSHHTPPPPHTLPHTPPSPTSPSLDVAFPSSRGRPFAHVLTPTFGPALAAAFAPRSKPCRVPLLAPRASALPLLPPFSVLPVLSAIPLASFALSSLDPSVGPPAAAALPIPPAPAVTLAGPRPDEPAAAPPLPAVPAAAAAARACPSTPPPSSTPSVTPSRPFPLLVPAPAPSSGPLQVSPPLPASLAISFPIPSPFPSPSSGPIPLPFPVATAAPEAASAETATDLRLLVGGLCANSPGRSSFSTSRFRLHLRTSFFRSVCRPSSTCPASSLPSLDSPHWLPSPPSGNVATKSCGPLPLPFPVATAAPKAASAATAADLRLLVGGLRANSPGRSSFSASRFRLHLRTSFFRSVCRPSSTCPTSSLPSLDSPHWLPSPPSGNVATKPWADLLNHPSEVRGPAAPRVSSAQSAGPSLAPEASRIFFPTRVVLFFRPHARLFVSRSVVTITNAPRHTPSPSPIRSA
ncbi:unnamed protein product [Closterium sp. NIES-64]|nr:unnamed protein product [Closterium sp. NIES-64]